MGFRWRRRYSVRVEALDRQHQRLFGAIDELRKAADKAGGVGIEGPLKRLILLAAYHFAAEERLMGQCGYPGLALHRQQHREWTSKLEEFQRGYALRHRAVQRSLLAFLEDWLKRHILEADKRYSDMMNAKGVH